MAKFLLTNNPSYFEKGKKVIYDKGFMDGNEYHGKDISLITFAKKVKKMPNLFVLSNGDFCGVVGTAIYQEQNANYALEDIYDEYNGNPSELRRKLVGNYVFFIKKNYSVKVFCDEYEIKECYYAELSDGWLITDSLECFIKVDKSIGIELNSLIEKTLLVNSIGEQTIWKGVSRLLGTGVINCSSQGIVLKKNVVFSNAEQRYSTMEEAIDAYSEMIQSVTDKIFKVFGKNISIHQTGGLDNRTVFSAFRSVGCTPNMLYGSGDSVLTSTKKEDRDICLMYKKKFGNELYDMDWTGDVMNSMSQWEETFGKYGFDSMLYGGAPNFFAEYEGRLDPYPDFMECGYFLEALRLRDFARDMKGDEITLECFIDDYLIGGAYGNVDDYMMKSLDLFKKNLVEKIYFSMNGSNKGYAHDKEMIITRDSFDKVRWIHARRTDSLMLNFLNNYTSSIAIFSLKNIHDFPLSLPSSWRANARFQIELINKLEPKSLELPFFTHREFHKLDFKAMSLTPVLNLQYILKKIAKKLSLRGRFRRHLSNLYFLLTNNAADTINVNDEQLAIESLKLNIRNSADILDVDINVENFDGGFAYLYMLAQTLNAIKAAKREEDVSH